MADPRARRALVILVVCAVGAVLAVVALVALGGDDDGAEAGSTTTTAAGDPVAVDRVEVGTCFNDAADEGTLDYTDLPVVGCEEPHDNEVYHLFESPGGPTTRATRSSPTSRATAARGVRGLRREALHPVEPADPPHTPSEASWEVGDREVVCAVYDGERTELTGSVRGSAR